MNNTEESKRDTNRNRPKRKPKRRVKARCGLISSTLGILEKFSENNEETSKEIFAQEQQQIESGLMNLKKDTTEGILDVGKSHHIEASLAEAKVGDDDIGAKTSLLSASAHCEYGLNNSAGVNASLVRAEGHLGPIQVGTGLQCDCNASIGVNGVEASFLGTGFSIGPKVGIKTPFIDLSVKLF